MDVQKYIKRLKFARADMSRATGPFETRDEAINFLNSREFFFGDPFVVKYADREDNGEVKLLLAIGKANNASVTPDMTEVSGSTGPEAYELFDINELKEQLEQLWEALNAEISARTEADQVLQDNIDAEASARTEADEHLQEQIDEIGDAIDALNDIIGELSGATEALEEIVGEGWTDSPDNVTITDRIKRDEALAGIVWGHNDGEPYDGHLPNTELPYASGESVADMIKTISDVLDGVLFEDGDATKAIKFEYNSARNILYYTAGTETGEIKLSQASVVDRAYYDAATEELVIIFNLGEGETQEVRIPVGGLITEWTVENTNTVELAKTRVVDGSDVLTANVKVSDDSDNMLVAKEDGLYVSNSGLTNVENVVNVLKEDIGTLADGHFPTDYFSGSTINGSSNLQEALLKLDGKLAEDEAKHNEDIAAINSAMTQANDAIEDEVSARESIKLVKLPQETLDADVREAYVLSNNGETGDTVIKIYKDSVIYKIYFGHVDDQITSPTDPTIIDGTGEDAICFIYYNANGEYELSTNAFDFGGTLKDLQDAFNESQEVNAIALNRLAEAIVDLSGNTLNAITHLFNQVGEIGDDLEELGNSFSESQEVTAIALNRLAEGVVQARTAIVPDGELNHIILDKAVGPNGEDLYYIGESNIADVDWLTEVADYARSIKLSQLSQAQIEELYGSNTNVLEAYYLVDENHTEPTMDDTIVKIYKDSVTVDDVNSFELGYDSAEQDLVLTWEVAGSEHTSRVNVSDFVKDSFLENVQVVTRDGVQYLEFRFKTYDGEPIPIYIPLSDFAVIYKAGDGIDADELVNNQVITVKIDPMHEGENSWLAKEPNGLRVTGLTEYIDEKIAEVTDYVDEQISGVTQSLNDYVRKDEVEDHLDSASTLPVQNKVVTNALNELVEQFEEMLESLTAITADTIVVNNLTASTANIENLTANTIVTNEITGDTAVFNHITAETILTESITGDTGYFSGLTANTIYADEYQNLPTATTTQYGVVLVDDHLDSASTNPVENRVLWQIITDDEEVTSAALNDLNDRKADKEYVDNAVSSITIDVDSQLDSASTNPVENRAIWKVINDDELVVSAALNHLNNTKADKEYVDDAIDELNQNIENNYYDKEEINELLENISSGSSTYLTKNEFGDYTAVTRNEFNTNNLTAVTGNFENITAQTILTNEITGTSAYFTGVTANTIYADEYYNLPTATTNQYGLVKVDDHLDSASTNPVENRVLWQIIVDDEETISAALNSLNRRSENLENRVTVVEEAIETLAGGGLTGVTTTGQGNVVTNIEKDGLNVKATLGNVDVSNKVDTTVFNNFTASTLNNVTSAGTGMIVTNVEKDGTNVKVTKTNNLTGLNGLTANTISATTYQNLPAATSGAPGVVVVDTALSTSSTNPVENRVVAQAINNLSQNKADASSLSGYLPLSGGTMTGNISGNTGVAVYMPGGFFQQSDETLKIFMGDIENALEKANKIPTKYFYWKDRYDGPRELGTSAQKVQEVFPEIVSGGDKLSVDYSKLAIVALAAIKELTAKVEDLQNQLNELKK